MKKLCVYSIIKNEIDHLEEWYSRVKSADYVYLLDTGSTDGTLEKIEELNIPHSQKVYDYFSFAQARNDCLALAKEVANDDSWIFAHIDIDEYLDNNAVEEIKNQWQDSYDQMSLSAHNVNGMYTAKIHGFTNELFWDYAIHETIRAKNNRILVVTPVLNTGYNHYQNTDKPRNYYEKLKTAIEHEGLRVRYLVYAAWEAILHDEVNNCINYAKQAVDNILYNEKDEYYQNYFWLTMSYYYILNNNEICSNIGNLEFVNNLIECEQLPDFRANHVKLAQLYTKNKNFEFAVAEYLKCLKIKTPLTVESWLDDESYYNNEFIYINLELLNYYNEKYLEAISWATLAVNENNSKLNQDNLKLCVDKYKEIYE